VGLVAPPPQSPTDGPTTIARTVRLTSVAGGTSSLSRESGKRLVDLWAAPIPVVDVVDWVAGGGRTVAAAPDGVIRLDQRTASPTSDSAPNTLAVTNAALATSPLETVVAVVLGGALLVFLGGAIVVAYVYGFIGYNIIDPILGVLGAPTGLSTAPISNAKVDAIPPALSEAPVQKKTRPVTTSLRKAVDSVRDSFDARAVINSAVGRQNGDKTGNAVGASAVGDDESDPVGARPIRRTPVREAIASVCSDLTKVVSQIRDGVKRTLGGAQRAATTNDADGQGPREAP
jgi:hypothetical protein